MIKRESRHRAKKYIEKGGENKVELVEKFIRKMHYLENPKVIGAILYGSYQTKQNNSFSDVDIMVFFEEDTKQNIKGYQEIDGVEFEYYERTLSAYYKRIDKDYQKGEDTLLSALGHGRILWDYNGKVAKLQAYAREVFSNPLPGLKENEKCYLAKGVQKAMKRLEYNVKTDSDFFAVQYAFTLEKLRTFYHLVKGYSSLTLASVYKVYTREAIQKLQYKVMPEETFIKQYLACLRFFKSK